MRHHKTWKGHTCIHNNTTGHTFRHHKTRTLSYIPKDELLDITKHKEIQNTKTIPIKYFLHTNPKRNYPTKVSNLNEILGQEICNTKYLFISYKFTQMTIFFTGGHES